uniref:Mitochondrial carrier protein n=2 Tax=Corethron hystrix TaxID=216773 RepID=A0A7S1BNE3_9STRA|mmetsp:Transcript_33763/g.77945  ORF Transcript_33763/g.77945 Transcript_33763/m.77945 type:complete len:430 (+) Transcript_33763:124-1413(+)|eukprot:CAMPEP_0113315420 /NCGR_PEP_ID=MMETSP0010_2-20120614/11095_1 /TAXON_ID=216773 ORGANISM="Corethron hystrix, Strain 308" /NCGR_SAMPLE_ID=MMETSP0010_2 /ASSEMBLY_ACC=CAM_ASM_000155 /LENGTH=429 /DNA_ID=CAMNT_0000171917 /DNA_START=53 /DNA_END=1342 /DNA_ORIENTATION=+ /assembly_acc=CAM_ASM_000155
MPQIRSRSRHDEARIPTGAALLLLLLVVTTCDAHPFVRLSVTRSLRSSLPLPLSMRSRPSQYPSPSLASTSASDRPPSRHRSPQAFTPSSSATAVPRTNRSPRRRRDLPPASSYTRKLCFWETMICGAVSRSVAQTIMHPANTMKTILQSRGGPDAASQFGLEAGRCLIPRDFLRPPVLRVLKRGAGAQLLLSLPHGALNFAVLETTRRALGKMVGEGMKNATRVGPGLDFLSSGIATVCCSVVSTPQMMITDNIMAGTYPNMAKAISGLAQNQGLKGFYTGWFPGIAGKIPSYGLTWVLFQQLKKMQLRIMQRPPKNYENSVMGALASATTVSIMIPMDTIKTRLVTQVNYPNLVPYKGIADAFLRILREEGLVAFYRGLPPRLISVVPMIGIQFGIYEFMVKAMLARDPAGTSLRGNMVSLTEGEAR